MVYLSQKELTGLTKYKYSGTDTSPVSKYVTRPFWGFLVDHVYPPWLAPNLLTFMGWLFCLSDPLLVACFDLDLKSSTREGEGNGVPSWVWIWCGIAQFVGHTMDGSDGMQARKTKSSSPLGELFDHGLDSSTASLQTVTVISAIGAMTAFGAPTIYLLFMCVLLSFICSHAEKYTTGTLDLPWSYDVSQLALAAVMVATAFVGINYWNEPVQALGGSSAISVLPVGVLIGTVYSVVSSLVNIVLFRSKESTHRLTVLEAISPYLPVLWIAIWVWVWIAEQPDGFLESNLFVIMLWTGVMFSHASCRLIVAQMTGTHYRKTILLLLPLPLLWGLGRVAPSIPAQLLLYVYFAVSIAVHGHYWTSVVNEISTFLKIRIFHIKHPVA